MNFIAFGGVGNHSWNVVWSEADHILFKYAGESGVCIFDSVKVKEINFELRKDEPKANGTTKLDWSISTA